MKATAILVALALISAIAYSGVIVGTNVPTLTVTQSLTPTRFGSLSQIPVVLQYGSVTVPKQLWFTGLHGLAYKQLTYLYPQYRVSTVSSCSYTIYGPSRIYLFELLNGAQTIKLFSSVQNNDQATGQQTQESVQQQAKAQVNAKQANKQQKVSDQHSGYSVIKLSRAYQIPRVALAIKLVTRDNWRWIRSAPLVRCLQSWQRGVYNFRLYFDGIPTWFEYRSLGDYVSKTEEIESKETKSNLRADETKPSTPSKVTPPVASKDDQYLPRQQPIFTVKNVDGYGVYSWANFRKHAGYNHIVKQFTDHFGRFDQRWVNKVQYKVDVDVHYFQFQIAFVPFLVDCDLEAHWYGSTQKAALLKVDERVFNQHDHKQYVDKWGEIKQFNSYKAFKEANQFVLSQFTYLRFYKVTSAYSALHKNGRYVRLVYESQKNFFTPKGQNQFNILVYICDGRYYIDREDFLATNTYSFGKNDWVSLFVTVPDVPKYKHFNRIVKYFRTNHGTFWGQHEIEDIKFQDGLHVLKFRNPTNDERKQCALNIDDKDIKLLNHFDWQLVNAKSNEHARALSYVSKKYQNCTPLFAYTRVSPYGRHFEVSFLNDKKVFSNCYLRYVDAEDLFTEDQWQGIAYTIDFDEVVLPANPESHLQKWILDNEDNCDAVVEIKNVAKNTYQYISLENSQRWRVNVNWVKGQWIINNRQLINDGYYFLTGYPSVNVASCSGYLAKLYPNPFRSRWVYGSIQVKNIGYFIYNRVIYRLGTQSWQGVVRTTHGVENSHTLISWDKIRNLRQRNDYGYGVNYEWNYGYESRYFFDYDVRPVVKVDTKVEVDVVVVNVDKTDLLCSFWDDDKCIACYGDYFADTNGRCQRVQDECEFWKVSGNCSKCSYGWTVNGGVCVLARN